MMRVVEHLLFLFIFLIPWQARRVLRAGELNGGFWEYGTVALYATDALFLLIIVLAALWGFQQKEGAVISNFKFLISKQTTGTKSQILHVICYWLLVTGYVLFSILWSSEKLVAFYAALKLFEGIALFLIIRFLPIDRSKLAWALVASAVAQSILAIAQFFTQSIFAWPFSGIAPQNPSDLGVSVVQFGDERWLRAYGALPHPNALGAFLTIAFLLLLRHWRKLKGGNFQFPPPAGGSNFQTNSKFKILNSKPFLVSYFLFLVSGLFFTFSRAAWLAFFAGFIVYAVQSKAWKEKIFLQLALLLTVAVAVLTVLFFPLVRTRLGGGSRLEIQSNQERAAGYREAVQLMRYHPFLGVGIGNYTVAVARELRPNDAVWSYQPAHNVFLLVVAELGIVGLMIFLGFFWTVREKLSVIGCQLSAALFIFSLFDHSFWTLHSGIFLAWFSVAVAMKESGY